LKVQQCDGNQVQVLKKFFGKPSCTETLVLMGYCSTASALQASTVVRLAPVESLSVIGFAFSIRLKTLKLLATDRVNDAIPNKQ